VSGDERARGSRSQAIRRVCITMVHWQSLRKGNGSEWATTVIASDSIWYQFDAGYTHCGKQTLSDGRGRFRL